MLYRLDYHASTPLYLRVIINITTMPLCHYFHCQPLYFGLPLPLVYFIATRCARVYYTLALSLRHLPSIAYHFCHAVTPLRHFRATCFHYATTTPLVTLRMRLVINRLILATAPLSFLRPSSSSWFHGVGFISRYRFFGHTIIINRRRHRFSRRLAIATFCYARRCHWPYATSFGHEGYYWLLDTPAGTTLRVTAAVIVDTLLNCHIIGLILPLRHIIISGCWCC